METIDAFKARAKARTGVRFEDLRAGHVGEWDKSAVLAHLGIFGEEDAAAYGLAGDELAAAQRAALTGYARVMEGA